MNITAKDVIKVAEAELGYHEKASNSKLDDKTANSGSANYTKYARDLNKAGYFGGSLQGQAWCAMFVSWVFLNACGGDKAKAMALQCMTGSGSAGCGYVYRYYLAKNRVFDTPQPGDQFIVYNVADKTYDHTGLVKSVGKDSFVSIEGNKNNEVTSVTRKLKPSGYTYYFCRPVYDEVPPLKTCTVVLTQLEKGCQGTEVKVLQTLLKMYGYKDQTGAVLKLDGDFGSKTKFALMAYQVGHKLTGDGVCGAKTWSMLLKGV